MSATRPLVIRAADLAAYSPANHTGTSNVRVISLETVGATALEVLVGTIVKSHGAKPHAHPHLEQCAYMIEGTGESQAQGRAEVMGRGTWSYVPAGAFHSFRVTSEQPGRVLVVYAPPYAENPAHTITQPDPAVRACREARVLAPDEVSAATGALIDADTVGAQWVEIEAVRMSEGSELSWTARENAEQVLYLEEGCIDAHGSKHDFHLAAGDFLFLPPGTGVTLRCPTGGQASGFRIKGRLPSGAPPK